MNKYRASSQKDAFDESYWKVLKEALREGTDKRCRWTKGPARHKEIWWWNDDVSNSVSEMRKLWKEQKQGNRCKVEKGKARRAVYQPKCKAEKKRFRSVMRRDDQKCDVFKIGKRMFK